MMCDEVDKQMNADAFRHFYHYHFAQNRTIWDTYIRPLSFEQFTQDVSYSHGSVRRQLIHIMNADDTWFSALRGAGLAEPYSPATFDDRKLIRANWDELEQNMGDYLSNLRDDMLFQKPFSEGEDKNLILWQVLLHVVNHGTDHRAQILRILHDLGVKTRPQDYIFYVYDNP
jgi:uncharacterized damage-inducible protein DinB